MNTHRTHNSEGGYDRMVVGFTTTYALAYHHTRCKFESHSVTCDRSIVFTGYSCSLHQMTDRQDITDILLKVGLITIAINHDVYVEMTDEILVFENASENTNTLDGLLGGGGGGGLKIKSLVLCLWSDVSETRSMNRTRFLHISTSKDDLTI